MDKEFPLEYTERKGYVFDVSRVKGRDISVPDVDMAKIGPDMFVGFYTGFIEEAGYGSELYYAQQPQLSDALIDALLHKGISLIGIDFAGVRKGKEHTPKDQYCADQGVFIIENLCNLKSVAQTDGMIVNTYPVNYAEVTGLPCRVICKI